MKRGEIRALIEEVGIFPAVRVSSPELAIFAAESVNGGGIPIMEITMTVQRSLDVITQLAHDYPELIVGAGTVLDTETAQRCFDAGARFLTSPGLVLEVIDFALQRDMVIIPSALTPSEVITAWRAGVDFVNIFPCAPVGGDSYLRSLKVPLPQISLIASGGVNQLTAANFIRTGASAIGIGSELMPREALLTRNREWIHELARRFRAIVLQARTPLSEGTGW